MGKRQPPEVLITPDCILSFQVGALQLCFKMPVSGKVRQENIPGLTTYIVFFMYQRAMLHIADYRRISQKTLRAPQL